MNKLCIMAFCVGAFAQSDHPNLTGNWQCDAAKSEVRAAKTGSLLWKIDEKDGSIAIQQMLKDEGGRTRTLRLDCEIGGKECAFDDEDGRAKASFWYNGPMLVEMKTARNDRVSKTRMKLVDDGKTLDVDIQHLTEPGKSEHLVFSKQQ